MLFRRQYTWQVVHLRKMWSPIPGLVRIKLRSKAPWFMSGNGCRTQLTPFQLSGRSGREVPLRIYPGGIKTRVAWHEVPGKKKKDASSPIGTVDQGFLQMCHSPFLGLGGIAKQNGIHPKCIGGVADHVHLLLSMPTTMAMAKAIQLIKSGSSAWIHQTFRELRNFGWQQG